MLPTPARAYLCTAPMDMHRPIDALSLYVEALLGRPPFSGEVFVFLNKGLNKVKPLWWGWHGFWLAYKRLEKGRFQAFPKATELSWPDLMLVLEGVDLSTRCLAKVPCERINLLKLGA